MRRKDKKLIIVLDNIRSAHNVGSIFRTADAAGVSKIFLTGYTPAPVNEFGQQNKEISKTALGAERFIQWEKRKNLGATITALKAEGYHICAVEQSPRSINYVDFKFRTSTALIFGNEVKGLSPKGLAAADTILEIPMKGKKESLNVSVAFGVVVFSLLARN